MGASASTTSDRGGARERSVLTDVAALLLLAWAGLIAYVSVPTLLSDDPLWDGGVSVLGAFLAGGHLVAAVGILRRIGWGRRLGLALGVIGLLGSGAVLLTLAANLGNVPPVVGEAPLTVLAIPAGMAATYAVVVVALLRAKAEFGA